MSKRRRFFLVSSLTVLIVLGLVTSSHAVLSFVDGTDYLSKNKDFQDGYAGGAVDMLRGLQDAGKIGPPDFNSQAVAILNCVAKSTDSKIDAMLKTYVQNNPSRAGNNAATMIYNAMRVACNIN
jgi:hypothetical protein